MSAIALDAIPLAPADRVRVINRSVRCFVFGVIGAVPCFGLSMAWLAFKLYREVAAETGERVNLVPLHFFTVSLILAAASAPYTVPQILVSYGLLIFAMQVVFLWRQYRRNAPAEWNPARHLIYYGIGFANLGILLSYTVVLLVIYWVGES
jgi:hypothetical protein